MGKDDKCDKMYICLEKKAKQKGKSFYMICSIELSDLTTQLSGNAVPDLKLEKKIQGYESMGCGIYGSKIVFTGGQTKRNGFITFDFTTHKLSHTLIPFMRRGKVKPLVFELDKRLYVFDVSSCYYEGAFEYYSPFERRWHDLVLPYNFPVGRCRKTHDDYHNHPNHGHSLLIFGNTCYFHFPTYERFVFFHHPSYTHQTWLVQRTNRPFSGPTTTRVTRPINRPFSGPTTFYRTEGFYDSVVISFDFGVVSAHRFCLQTGYPDHPIYLFEVKPSSESKGNLSGFFADMHGGIFTLTAYDDVCIYLYTFKIARYGRDGVFPMVVECDILSIYHIKFSSLALGTRKLSVAGCFASSPNPQATKSADDVFGSSMLRFVKRCDQHPSRVIVDGKKRRAPRGPIGQVLCSSRGNCVVT